ncbi:outer membrane protein assembly factor BamA [bacterium]|nr:outer membrane protein assembly factor BamA [bacterium]
MKRSLTFFLSFQIILLISMSGAIFAEETEESGPRKIIGVVIHGNASIDDETILFNVKTKPGEYVSLIKIREDIKNLYRTGFFDEVSVDMIEQEKGVIITFIVREKPIVTKIEIVGNKKVSTDTLEKELNVQVKKIYDPLLVKKDEEKIRAKYIEQGYNDVEIKSEIIHTSSLNVTVIYKVIEGIRVRIEDISFTGNYHFKEKKLRKVLKSTREYWMFSWLTDSGKFNQDEFDADLDLLREFYENRGFAEVEIGEPDVKIFEEQVSKQKIVKKMKIMIPLNEGEQYRVGNIDITGNTVFETPQILKIVQQIDSIEGSPDSLFKMPEPKFRQGEIYSRKAMQDAVKNLYELYGTRGYIFANIIPTRKTMVETRSIDFTFEIYEGKQAFIHQIEFKGNQRTRDKVIRRELRIFEGDIFDSSKLRYSLSRLNYLGYIENINPEFNPTIADPQQLDITINMTDERRTELQLGGGYSSLDKVFLAISFSEYNFLGYGQEMQLSLINSSRRQEYSVSFNEDYLFDTRNALSVSMYNRSTQYYEDFDRRATGGNLGVGRHFFEYVFGRISYQYEQVEIYDVADDARESIKDAEGSSITSGFLFFLQRDRRDNRRNPTRGTRHYVTYEINTSLFGGDNIYYKATYDGSFFMPLLNKVIYGFHTRVQYADGYSGHEFPSFEYLVLGGERSIRGTESSSIGPKDLNYEGETIGGNKALLFNHELIFPIADPLRLILFYDQGDVYGLDENYDLRTLRETVGIELQIFVPMFWVPIRFIWGYNLKKYDFENQSEFQFTIGSMF